MFIDLRILRILRIWYNIHPWDESHLIMVYDLFNVLRDAVCQYFVENFSVYVHQRIGLKFSFFVVSLSGLGIRMMDDAGFIKRVWESSISLDFFE